jgi:lipid-A-disaccharide synthase
MMQHKLSLLDLCVVAGEPSGDLIGALSLSALTQQLGREIQVAGVAGQHLQDAGVTAWYDMQQLAVRGYVEVLRQLPRLLWLRHQLTQRIIATRPKVFMGIDAPDFNLSMEVKLKQNGIRTLHLVSPSIWAWRKERMTQIKQAVSHMLCIFPFEPAIYAEHGIPATFVGHPIADKIPLTVDVQHARDALNLVKRLSPTSPLTSSPIVAFLPGSRNSEIQWIAPAMLGAIGQLQRQHVRLHSLIPVVHESQRVLLVQQMQVFGLDMTRITLAVGQSHTMMAAADVIVVASGTATLEAALYKKPMIITYKMPALSYWWMKRQAYLPWVGLPNILCQRTVVPELLQHDCTAVQLAQAIEQALANLGSTAHHDLIAQFHGLHQQLRCNTPQQVAHIVSEYL